MNKNLLLKKIVNHFDFIKKTNNFSELLVKHIPTKNINTSLIPISMLHNNDKKINKIVNLNIWLKNKNNLSFYLLNKNHKIELVLGIASTKNLSFVLLLVL